jgi:hypothetical protein
MAYTAYIHPSQPTAILFIIDKSSSMSGEMPLSAKSKAHVAAEVLNETLGELIARCTRDDGVKDYLHIGILAYNGDGVKNVFQSGVKSNVLNLVSRIDCAHLRMDKRVEIYTTEAGESIERELLFPVWIEPGANGGAPMCRAISRAKEVLAGWCSEYTYSFPPTVIHITGGIATDGNPERLAEELKQIGTNDGQVLSFNLHLCEQQAEAILYPASDSKLPNRYSEMLFRMSSVLPPSILDTLRYYRHSLPDGSRCFAYNADITGVANFFDIGRAIPAGAIPDR